jgi:hypothetical protein
MLNTCLKQVFESVKGKLLVGDFRVMRTGNKVVARHRGIRAVARRLQKAAPTIVNLELQHFNSFVSSEARISC